MTTQTLFKIGTTSGGLVLLSALTPPVMRPKSTFSPYATVVELGDGSKRGIGSPVATWHWDFLPQAQRDVLRTYCPGVSSEVFIQTYTKDGGTIPKRFSCRMHWPVTEEETQTSRALDFRIDFTQMEAIA